MLQGPSRHSFHSFAPLSTQFFKSARPQNASRTRLTTDLQPGSSTSRQGGREYKPKPSFTRDTAPHADPGYVPPSHRNISFRRSTMARDEMDWKRRRLTGEDAESTSGKERVRQGAPPRRTDRDRSSLWDRRGRTNGEDRTTRETARTEHEGVPRSPAFQRSRQSQSSHEQIHDKLSVPTEFYRPPPQSSVKRHSEPVPEELATKFTSPPLMPGLLSCLTDTLGPAAAPTPIQSLSLKWLLDSAETITETETKSGWKQFLLASETGSGKSIAYLLPLLQNLKLSELSMRNSPTAIPAVAKRALNPRALILAPTHELARQLSGFAKALLHEVKLRVLCASRANVKNTKERDATTRKMVAQFEEEVRKSAGHSDVEKRKFPVDVVIGTPMKLLEMVRGRGWDRKEGEVEEDDAKGRLRRGRDKMVGFGKWRNPPEMGLANVEWVIVDEADVLFDPDFQATTRQLLADISEARGHAVPFSLDFSGTDSASKSLTSESSQPLDYPFNFVLTSATIPMALASYLDKHHPTLVRLASPNLHHLPKTLQTEYVNWTGGNKFADIERRIRKVWAEDTTQPGVVSPLSKVLIFCNKSTKVHDLGAHLEQKKIKNVALTSTSDQRKRGSNRHLEGFLQEHNKGHEERKTSEAALEPIRQPVVGPTSESRTDPKEEPHVMITTSLLSRGLDFSPSIRHVFIVDEPRNMIDFLHRAGRAGRAGQWGKVVVFGKMKGRGSAKAKDVRKRVGALLA